MTTSNKIRVILSAITAVLIIACTFSQSAAPAPDLEPLNSPSENDELPVYVVTQTGVTADAGQSLADALDLSENPWDEDGALRHLDQDRFQHVPTIPLGTGEPDEDGTETTLEAFDLDALQEITTVGDDEALSKAQSALEQAGLVPFSETSHIQAATSIGHSTFDIFDPDSTPITSAVLDTQVLYDLTLNGVPLIGPGAKIKLVFDGDGVVTQLHYAMRSLEPGETVPIISQPEAEQRCRETYGGDVQVQAELIYYAPPLEMSSVTKLYPHYACGGIAVIGGEEFSLANMAVPAMVEMPQVQLTVAAKGNTIVAQTDVTGGTSPYNYYWSSSSTPLDPDLAVSGAEIQYAVTSREPVNSETVGVIVTDVDGLVVGATETIPFEGTTTIIESAGASSNGVLASPQRVFGITDVGVEWTGYCCTPRLPPAGPSASHYANIFRRDQVTVSFNWGEKLAWERDFRDRALGGTDHIWADFADLTYVTAHGQPKGFGLCVEKDTRPFYHNTAHWGNYDLEWMALDSCNVMQLWDEGRDLAYRWGDAFQGMHIMMGYDTEAWSRDSQGYMFAVMLTGNDPLNRKSLSKPRMVRQAWADMSTINQPSQNIYAIMGPCGERNGNRYLSNFNDWFHGEGPVGPDIRGASITAFWLIRSPC